MEDPKQAKILFIDDNQMHRKMYTLQFHHEGYDKFTTIASGKEGIEYMKENKPDLLLLDMVLEDMDGIEVLKQMKQDTNLTDIPVIMLSNIREKDKGEKARQLGVVDYLLKANFLPTEVIERVKQFLISQP